jgi:hypothetical protein
MFQLNNFLAPSLIIVEIGFARSLVLELACHGISAVIAITARIANIFDELPDKVTAPLYELIEDVLLKTDTIDVISVKLSPLV